MKMSKFPILMYHSISSSSNPRFQQFAVPVDVFAERMAYLCDHDYTPESSATVLSQLYARSRTPVWQLVRQSSAVLTRGQRK